MRLLKMTLTFLCCYLIALQSFAYTPSDEPITFEDLPLTTQTFIQEQFAHMTVTRASYNTQDCLKCYEVHLSDNTTLRFDDMGNWCAIERVDSEVPTALIPERIQQTLNDRFAGIGIYKLEKDTNSIKVGLANKEELVFNTDFQLLDFEDDTSNVIEE